MPVQKTTDIPTPANVCVVVDNNADELKAAVAAVVLDSNGVQRTVYVDQPDSIDTNYPLFSDFVVSGLVATLQAPPNALNIAFGAGEVQLDAKRVTVSGATVAVLPGDLSDPRVDLVVVDGLGTISVVTGTPGPNPVAPLKPAGTLELAVVGVPVGAVASAATITVTAVNLGGVGVPLAAGQPGQMAYYDGTAWVPIPNSFVNVSGANALSYGLQADDGTGASAAMTIIPKQIAQFLSNPAAESILAEITDNLAFTVATTPAVGPTLLTRHNGFGGFEVPSVTSADEALLTPNPGSLIFNIDTNKLRCWDGTAWNDCF